MGFSRQEYWSGLPFPSPVDHILSELSTMIRPSWVALHSMAHSFIELDKAVVHVIRLINFLWWWFSVCLPLMETDKRLMKVSWWDRLTEGESVIIHLEPDILECEVKWALGSITTNKASGGDGIPVELFQILKDDAVKVLHSICQQIWRTQQCPQDWKRCFHSNPKERQCQRLLKLPHNCTNLTC